MLSLPPAPAPAPRRQVLTGTAVAGAAAAMVMGSMLAVWWRFREASPLVQGKNGMIAGWVPKGVTVPMVPANTMLLTMVVACVMAQYAVYAAKRADRMNTGLGLIVTGVLGIAAINAQATIYTQMELGIRDGAYQSMFYAVTGTFVVFLVIGIVLSLITVFRSLAGTAGGAELVSAHAVFWYVLTGIFCALWFVVYVTK